MLVFEIELLILLILALIFVLVSYEIINKLLWAQAKN